MSEQTLAQQFLDKARRDHMRDKSRLEDAQDELAEVEARIDRAKKAVDYWETIVKLERENGLS